MLDQIFGEAGSQVIVEEVLQGEEVSIVVFTDGLDFRIISSVRNYKRLNDADKGPNTGGMGCHGPAIVLDARMTEIKRTVIRPTIMGLQDKGLFIF